jgi:hypothetical protein
VAVTFHFQRSLKGALPTLDGVSPYILEGDGRILLADEWITAGVGDFINVILTFTPAGIENFFQETLQPTLDPTALDPEGWSPPTPADQRRRTGSV